MAYAFDIKREMSILSFIHRLRQYTRKILEITLCYGLYGKFSSFCASCISDFRKGVSVETQQASKPVAQGWVSSGAIEDKPGDSVLDVIIKTGQIRYQRDTSICHRLERGERKSFTGFSQRWISK